MPDIRHNSTVDAVANYYCGEGKRNKTQTMIAIGYGKGYADSGRGHAKVFGNERVKAAISRIDADNARDSKITIAQVLADIAFAMEIAKERKDLASIARLSELYGKHLSMWSESGANAEQPPAPIPEQDRQELKAAAAAAVRLKLARG